MTEARDGWLLGDAAGAEAGPEARVQAQDAKRTARYERLLAPIPDGVAISADFAADVDLWHLFTTARGELESRLPVCLREIVAGGMIWVSWPKKASGVASEVTEDTVREVALPLGLVDVKVCAVDDTWSGLKLVVRKDRR